MRNNKGRSLTPPEQLKSDYLEYRVREHRKFDVPISHAEIVQKDFPELKNVSRFMKRKRPDFLLELRKYVYKMRGKYGNNKMV